MKKIILFFSSLFIGYLSYAQSVQEGEKIFSANCTACHSIGKGKLVGPDLKDVQVRRKEAWLLKFIKSPGTAIKVGDPIATQLFEENNKILMPDHSFLSDSDIKNIIAYIADKSKASAPVATEQKAETQPAASGKEAAVSKPISTTGYMIFCLLGISAVLLFITMYMVARVYNILKMKQ